MLTETSNYFEIFPWTENFNTDIEEIDLQHKELLSILNRLAAHLANLAEISTLEEVFDELIAYTDYHFKTEEKIWDEYFKDDPLYIEHKKTHNSFVDEVLKLKENTENKPHEDMIRDIVSFLSKWLAYHILDTDKLMAKTVIAINNGSSFEEAKIIAQEEMSGSMRVLIDTVLEMYNTLSSATMNLMREKTLRKRAQEELEQKNKELEKLLLIQSAQASMGQMISFIAHQWKQPLSIVSMLASNISFNVQIDEVKNDVLEENANNILAQVTYLSNTIDDFRNYFNPNRELEELNITTYIENVVNIIGKSLEIANIKLTINIVNDFSFKAYKNELIQVMLNILNNSKDALVQNNPKDATIKIEAYERNDKVCIDVEDNGGGIIGDVDKIFEYYYTTKSATDGTGLGLYMVKNIIEKHLNGKINAHNNTTGAIFKIELPYH